MKRAVLLLSVFLLSLAAITDTGAAVNCHCFRDRTFDPSSPAKADPYLLATARNGFLAGAAGIEKGAVVKARMAGVGEDDLWIAHRMGALAALPPERLLSAREKALSWREALLALGVADDLGGPAFTLARGRGDDAGMARALADEALREGFGLSGETVDALRSMKADNGEAALAAFFSAPEAFPQELLGGVKCGKWTWGQILSDRGIPPGSVGDRIAGRVREALRPTPPPSR